MGPCLSGPCQHPKDNGTGTSDKRAPVCCSKPIFLLVCLRSAGEAREPRGRGIVPWNLWRMEREAARAPPSSSPALFGHKKVGSGFGGPPQAAPGGLSVPNPSFPRRRPGLRAGRWRRERSGLAPAARPLRPVTCARRSSPRIQRDTPNI